MNKRMTSQRLALFTLVLVASFSLLLSGCGRRAAPQANLEIESVSATSQTSVLVVFNQVVGAGADTAENYRVAGPDGGSLRILAAYPAADGVSVTLATEPQQLVTYGLTVRGIQISASGGVAGELSSQGGFGGSGETAPIVASAIALSNSQVLVTFADPTNAKLAEMGPGAVNPAYYEIANPGLQILGAVYASGGTDKARVILTTSPMSDAVYTVKVTNVLTLQGNKLVDPFLNTASFNGITKDDKTAPTVTDAFATGNTTLVVKFSEPVSDNAADPSHYIVTDPDGAVLPVVLAVLNEFKTEVTLTTWPMTGGVDYNIVVQDITDKNSNAVATNATTFSGTPVDASTDTAPRAERQFDEQHRGRRHLQRAGRRGHRQCRES